MLITQRADETSKAVKTALFLPHQDVYPVTTEIDAECVMDRPVKLLGFKELKSKRGINFCRQHLWRLEQANKFPHRVQVGEHHIAWVEAEIDDYIAGRMAMRPS